MYSIQLPPLPLSDVVFKTADRMYEDMLTLQTECTRALDSDRKQKILKYCEIQRHRALQLIALFYYATNDSQIVKEAVEGVGRNLDERWFKNQASWNPEAALPDFRQYSAREAVRIFWEQRAPKYDIESALNTLVNKNYKPLPSCIEIAFQEFRNNSSSTDEEESRRKRQKIVNERILSKLISEEVGFETTTRFRIRSDEILFDCPTGAYSVRLSLEIFSIAVSSSDNLFLQEREK